MTILIFQIRCLQRSNLNFSLKIKKNITSKTKLYSNKLIYNQSEFNDMTKWIFYIRYLEQSKSHFSYEYTIRKSYSRQYILV